MKRAVWVLLLAAAGAWAQPGQPRGSAEDRELAEAYWLVGRQYALLGEAQKAREYQGLARRLDPGLDPAALTALEAERLPPAPQTPSAPPAGGAEPGVMATLLQSRFLRLLSAFLAEDTAALLSLLDGSVWFSAFGAELDREAIAADLSDFFARANLAGGLAPSAVFDLGSLEVVPVQDPARGPCYAVRITARADFSEELAFWERRQQYLYQARGGQWLLFAVGSTAPPASWRPQAPPAALSPARARPAEAGELRSIREAFLASLRHFLARRPAEASRYFAAEILVVRLNATLTRAELASTFEGYLEGGDPGAAGVEQVVDTGSIRVEPSERFPGLARGPEYRLSVRARLDLSDRIPFWTRFQEYYFSREQGEWRIFAIF